MDMHPALNKELMEESSVVERPQPSHPGATQQMTPLL